MVVVVVASGKWEVRKAKAELIRWAFFSSLLFFFFNLIGTRGGRGEGRKEGR